MKARFIYKDGRATVELEATSIHYLNGSSDWIEVEFYDYRKKTGMSIHKRVFRRDELKQIKVDL